MKLSSLLLSRLLSGGVESTRLSNRTFFHCLVRRRPISSLLFSNCSRRIFSSSLSLSPRLCHFSPPYQYFRNISTKMALSDPHQVETLASPTKRAWWKESTVYQIYPASFRDSNGDGIGDIPGIISELDYIASLGVDIVWLSPILASPQVDMGYDISDYKNIHPPYGTMADHDAMIKGLHDRGMKYVMDLVVNHTSDQHEWFKQSRSSKDNPYRDWYYWRPAKGIDKNGNRIPPNNWRSFFGGSVWEWDDTTQEYYLHLFAKEQPDLRWENPKVVEAVHDVVRFWLKRGVDGFRMDVINFISKPFDLDDAPITAPGEELQWGIDLFACGPRLHEYFQGLGAIMKEFNAFNVGEMPGVYDAQELLKAVGQDRGELQMSFNFEIVGMDTGDPRKFSRKDWELSTLKSIINKWQTFMIDNGGWNAIYWENHDQGRTVSRYGSDATPELRVLSGKMLATHLALLSGTLFIYQGQELAMANIPESWGMEKYRDLEALNDWEEILKAYPNDKQKQEEARREYRLKGRDNARTPMQWDSTANAGFCPKGVTPWMDVHEDYAEWNVEKQKNDPNSCFSYWRDLLALRKKWKDIFVYGGFEMCDMENPDVFAYVRREMGGKGQAALIVTNFKNAEVEWKIPEREGKEFWNSKPVAKNYADGPTGDRAKGTFKMRPLEAFVLLTE